MIHPSTVSLISSMITSPRKHRQFIAGEPHEIGVGGVQLLLEPDNLSLENGYRANTAVDRVLQPRLCLVREGVHRVFSLVGLDLVEELAHVARSEYFVDVGEFLGLLRGKVRREDAAREAFSP